MLALIECGRFADSQKILKELEPLFGSPDEEILSRWGRLYRDRGESLSVDLNIDNESYYT